MKRSKLTEYRALCDVKTFNEVWSEVLRDTIEGMSPLQGALLNKYVERLQSEFAHTRIGRLGAMEVLAAIGIWINSQEKEGQL